MCVTLLADFSLIFVGVFLSAQVFAEARMRFTEHILSDDISQLKFYLSIKKSCEVYMTDMTM